MKKVMYIQGYWKCKIIGEDENSYKYIPLEGYGIGQKGKVFRAGKDLFEQNRREVKKNGRFI